MKYQKLQNIQEAPDESMEITAGYQLPLGLSKKASLAQSGETDKTGFYNDLS